MKKKTFTFQNDDVAITTQKTFTRFANTQAHDAMAFAHHAHAHMTQLVRYFSQLDECENLLVEQKILTPSLQAKAEEEGQIRRSMLRSLVTLHDQIEVLKQRKTRVAAAMEEELERITSDLHRGALSPTSTKTSSRKVKPPVKTATKQAPKTGQRIQLTNARLPQATRSSFSGAKKELPEAK